VNVKWLNVNMHLLHISLK